MMQRAVPSFSRAAKARFVPARRAFSGLPPGWTEYKDPSDGTPYYYNSATKTTQWEKPAMDPPPPPPAAPSRVPKTEAKLPWETDAKCGGKLPWETDAPKDNSVKLPWETNEPKKAEVKLPWETDAPKDNSSSGVKLPWETDAPKKTEVKLPWETDAPKDNAGGVKLPWEKDAPKTEAKLPWETDASKDNAGGVKLPWEADAPKKTEAKLPWETDASKDNAGGVKLPWETDAPKKTEVKLPWETDAPKDNAGGVKLPWETDAPKTEAKLPWETGTSKDNAGGVKLPWETDAPKTEAKLPWETDAPHKTQERDTATPQSDNSESEFRFGSRSGGGLATNDAIDPSHFSLQEINWATEDLETMNKNFYETDATVAARTEEDVREQLRRDDVTIVGSDPLPRPMMTFAEAWGKHPEILNIVAKKKYSSPTVIQKIGWSVALSGRDMIGVAQTGSGKTMAFSLPAVANIRAQPPRRPRDGPLALVLVPTRELCQQIESDMLDFEEDANIKTLAVYGGAGKRHQIGELRRGVDIIVATPGRLMDLLQGGATNLKRVGYLVLDEADRMLDMGFEPQIRKVISQIRPDRQTMFWSATWPREVETLARDMCTGNAPVMITVGNSELTANKDILQQVLVMEHGAKQKYFFNWLAENQQDKKILVFSATKRDCDKLASSIESRTKQRVRAIHGGKDQPEREDVLHEFRSGKVKVVVATDVAARGLDISDIDFVVNYDCPKTVEDYIHRIGRTGRAGKRGTSLTFLNSAKNTENRRMAIGISKIMRDAGHTPSEDLIKLCSR